MFNESKVELWILFYCCYCCFNYYNKYYNIWEKKIEEKTDYPILTSNLSSFSITSSRISCLKVGKYTLILSKL